LFIAVPSCIISLTVSHLFQLFVEEEGEFQKKTDEEELAFML